ncbi:hypothetical protein [Alloscardovia omnicolens]|uniref:hypothetical protein n=1 Tax=Alloscardovia omnicolens TaxID=419015 RepID=UPI003A6A66A6
MELKERPVDVDVSRDELIEVLGSISIITKELTKRLSKTTKGENYGTHETLRRCDYKPSRM